MSGTKKMPGVNKRVVNISYFFQTSPKILALNEIKIHDFIDRKISIFEKEKKLTLERLI